MDDVMLRFLKSISIDNPEDYDLRFEMLQKDRFDSKRYNMAICKETPWNYSLLQNFIEHLSNITYPYSLRFSYELRPTVGDVERLYEEWFSSNNNLLANPLAFTVQGSSLVVTYTSEKEKEDFTPIIKEFREFLAFINYDFDIKEVEDFREEEVQYTKKEVKDITAAAEEEAQETISASVSEGSDYSYYADMNEENNDDSDIGVEVEDDILRIMKQNQKQMERERERNRINNRGTFTPYNLIDEIDANSGDVDISGEIFSVKLGDYRDKKNALIGIHDHHGGAIMVRAYDSSGTPGDLFDQFKKGINVRVRGSVFVNKGVLTIRATFIDLLPPDEIKHEKAETPRVELHLHTRMSASDAVSSITDYCEYAKALGHKAIAVTDHGVVQSFPEAYKAGQDTGLKIIYGCELYMVDHHQTYVYNPKDIPLKDATYVVLDLETTGLSVTRNNIIEFGAVRVEKGFISQRIDLLINPGYELSNKIINLTHITNSMIEHAPSIKEALPQILDFIGDSILVTHNAAFDLEFLNEELKRNGFSPLTNSVIDTVALSRYFFPQNRSHRLGALCRRLDVYYDESSAHRADYDAEVLNDAWQILLSSYFKEYKELNLRDIENLNAPEGLIKHLHPYHVTALAKNQAGLKNLYKLVSLSHTQYFSEIPKVPRHELINHRDGLLLGSACFNGEVFEVARNKTYQDLLEIMKFYDFIEIQPLENYSFLENIDELSHDEVIEIINTIIKAADELHLPIVATGDVHYVSPEKKVFRDVYISSLGVGKIRHPLNPTNRSDYPAFENPDQHYRSTDEMLKCFEYLGKDKAYEYVVTNTNLVADQIEEISPVPMEKLHTPNIGDSGQTIRDICYKKAHEIYGDPLPDVIETRLEKELTGIIEHGYAVIYYIAHLIVKKCNEDGFIVGSRGSVGSSLAAHFAGITEVNPLPPHYVCPHCHHFEWTSETNPEARSGYDLADKMCPECGTKMINEGQNIPFETFLGYEAEKVPDIDLNFAGEYQKKAHDYMRELLGENNVYRAGTIETVADKTAYAKAIDYITWLGYSADTYNKNKLNYLASGCVDVKRTTGQHPAGIIVIPNDYDVYDFTPIQYPADDLKSDWKTTHFDYRSLHDTILKIDLLGHDDPSALKMMSDLTGVDINSIPLNDKKVISIFTSTNALNLKSNPLNERNGALGIPEFGANFAQGVLEETKPQCFSDLVILSGISHGKKVWEGNAQQLLQNKTCTLSEVIGCRDDIMTRLISYGVPSSVAFSVMEDVRKGRGVKEEFAKVMRANNVPGYYINSCDKIKYLFPKGHATAYVMMAVRVAYFKVYYPLEYYATFFSVRSKEFDVVTMKQGEKAIMQKIDELRMALVNKGDDETDTKENNLIKTLQMACEMVERGYHFADIDLKRSDATNFIIDKENNTLIPPFITMPGIGDKVAQSIVTARSEREFFSKEDLAERTNLSSTNIKDLDALGVLDGLSETNQMSLFDLF
ncbi:MAG: PolC-type DNA polymerase III [Coprobacillus sp.]|nr:PolC-type DNA polymerase III [Coprobacillus sp.]